MFKKFSMAKLLFILALVVSSAEAFSQAPPTLLTPTNNSRCADVSMRFSWTPPTNGYKAKLVISDSVDLSHVVFVEDSIENTYFDVTNLEYNKKYYWKVVSYFVGDTVTSHSSIWNFTTKQIAAKLLSPLNNEYCISKKALFVWENIQTALRYRLEYCESPLFNANVTTIENIYNDSIFVDLPANNTMYYWRLQTIYSTCESNWSEVRVLRTKPVPVTLLSPANNTKGIPLFENGTPYNVTLKWAKKNGAHHYDMQLSANTNFTNLIVDNTNNTDTTYNVVDVLPTLPNTKYFWRVRVNYQNDSLPNCNTDWSEPFYFATPYAQAHQILPESLAICVPLNANFSWNKVTGAKEYRIQVSTSNTFADTLMDIPQISDTTTSVLMPNQNTTYYWRVKAEDTTNVGFWSAIRPFKTTIYAPAALAPLDSATGQALSQQFSWFELDTNAVYSLQISEKADFSTKLVDTVNLTKANFDYVFNRYDFKFYWRIKVSLNGCTSNWSKPYFFKTLLNKPVLETPTDSALKLPLNISFTWKAVTNASSYDIEYDTTAAFNSPAGRTGIPTNTILINGFAENTRFFWRVRAKNAEGMSAWSDVFTFTTNYQLADIPVLSTPNNASVMIPINVNLVWNKSKLADSYQLQVTEENEFSTTIIDTTNLSDTTFALNNLKNYKIYRWRVRAHNKGGYSEWSPIYYFRTIALVPSDQAALISPADAATNTETSVKLTWKEVNRAEAYNVIIAEDKDFTVNVVNDPKVWVVFKNLFSLKPLTKYYWKVRSWNEAGYGPWSEVYSFTTKAIVSVNEELIEKLKLSVSPNPISSVANISFVLDNSTNGKLELFNSNGELVKSLFTGLLDAGNNSISIDTQELASGAYILNLSYENNSVRYMIVVNK